MWGMDRGPIVKMIVLYATMAIGVVAAVSYLVWILGKIA